MGKIWVDGVSKLFPDRSGGAVRALDEVHLSIEEGEIVCLVGPSGCGKSTLLNLLAGFDVPSTGRILMDDAALAGAGPDRSVVFQSPSLFPWMTVLENVTFGPRKRGVPRDEYDPESHRMLQAVGLSNFFHHYPYELSGGMRQRVQIARALVNRPQVLLMDEPFAALDFQNRLAMQELLLQLWEQVRSTIFFITHDVEEAIFLGDRVHVMTASPGRIKASIEVPFAKPRAIEVVTTPGFVELKEQVLRLIRDEFARSDRAAAERQAGRMA